MSNKIETLKTSNQKSQWFSAIIDLSFCILLVLAIFLPIINRPWLLYDESIIPDGTYFPTPASFQEIFEILEKFGLNFNVLSSNSIYSSNYIRRTCPFSQVFWLVVNFIFQKKDPFLYHSLNLLLHLTNTGLVFFILNFCFTNCTGSNLLRRLLTIVLTSIWAIHPVTIEPVSLSTNLGANFSYMFFFAMLLDFLKNREKNNFISRIFIIPMLFMIPMLTNEYIVTLPFVLLIISFYFTYQNNALRKALLKSLQETTPYFIGFLVYLIYFLFFSNHQVSHQLVANQFLVLLERVFWLAPQIFFHFIKLLLYPRTLSIDQTLFVHLGKTIFDPYSIFCIIFFVCWLLIPLYLFLAKKRSPALFLLSWSFFFALLPYLHILMPSYTLSAERYLYASLALLVFSVGSILKNTKKFQSLTTITLLIILTLCFMRSHSRILDWKDNYSFINSTYRDSKDPLFKAIRAGMLGKVISIYEPGEKLKAEKYFIKTLKYLELAKNEALKNKSHYQNKLPAVIKSYGLDYDSLLLKIAFLETSTRCLELKQDYNIGLKILEPYIRAKDLTEPRILELYTHLLILEKKYDEAKELLLKANSIYPNLPFILTSLFELSSKYERDNVSAEKYLLTALKYYPYDTPTLLNTLNFYQEQNNPSLTAKYAYLYGLRTGSKEAYKLALSIDLNLDNLKDAKSLVGKLLRLDPNNPETLYFASKYYYKVKDFQRSLTLLKNAYSIIKNNNDSSLTAFDIAYSLITLNLSLGNKEEAISKAKEILNLAGNNLESLSKLSYLYQALGLTDYSNLCIKKLQKL
ncbi:MAG: hypothetical protein HY094_08295 [Candidatus Melainabacteria bacterium]|nr:hypothetical protein [Candidatus Melainabacteria bacterium]